MRSAFSLMAFAVFSVSPVEAEVGDSRKTLKGIQSMDVLIEIGTLDSHKERVEKAGLTVEQLRTDVELKLRLAGIKIDPAADDFLYINVSILLGETVSGRPTGDYMFNVDVGFRQMVRLARDPSISALAETWLIGHIATAQGNPKDRCREKVRDLVDNFVNAYLSVNPK
jgi:hypothetical protein